MGVYNLNKFTKKSYFDKVTSKGFLSNKAFWNTVKPFLTNKGFLTNENITIKHKDKIVTDNSKLAHLVNNHYINIDIPTAYIEEINKIIKELDPKKATGLDKIPPKIVKMSANIIDSHLANIINNDINKECFFLKRQK